MESAVIYGYYIDIPAHERRHIIIQVAIVEDDPEIRSTLGLIINGSEGFSCRQVYQDCMSALNDLGNDPPDVLLMDIGLPGMSGIEGVKLLKAKFPAMDIIMLTVHEDEDSIFQSLCAGADGYLTKDIEPQVILESIRSVFDGGSIMSSSIARKVVNSFQIQTNWNLSPREREILQRLCNGENYKTIAGSINLSGNTVRSHIKNIYKKLHAHSRAEAVSTAIKNKLV
jgi:DNA-binding NarL/FixJ family response regulator